MSEIYPVGDHQITPNLGLGLWGTDEVTSDNFILIDTAFASVGGSIEINGAVISSPNFIDSSSATLSVAGSNISIAVAGLTSPGTKQFYVDGNRTDIYIADGTVFRPFKTITAAVNQVVSNADNSTFVYEINISSATYVETVDLGNALIFNLVFKGEGVVVAPSSGNALQALTNNEQILTAKFYGITFNGPVNFTDSVGGLMLRSGCWFVDCRFWGNVTLSEAAVSNILTFYFWGCFSKTVDWSITNIADAYFFNCDLNEWPFPDNQSKGGSLTLSNTTGGGLCFVTTTGCQFYCTSCTIGVRCQIDVYHGVLGNTGTITVNGTLRMENGGITTSAVTVNSGGTLTLGAAGAVNATPTINAGGTLNFNRLSGGLKFVSPTFQSGSFSGPTWTSGTGVPATTPTIGSTFSRTDGGIGTSIYIYDGTEWAPLAQSKAVIASNFLTSYSAATGVFTAAQPTFTDLSAHPTTLAGYGITDAISSGVMTTLGDILYENNVPAPDRLAGNITTTKMYLSQTGTSAISAAPVWAQINYADITGTTPTPPSGSVLWSALGNAGAGLTLSNGANATEFDQTSNVAWLWKNTTVATPLTTNASPLLEVAANYWTGLASAADTWTLGSSLAAGTNGASTLSIAHTGSTGPASVVVPAGSNAVSSGYSLGFSGQTVGLSAAGNILQLQSGLPQLNLYANTFLVSTLKGFASGKNTTVLYSAIVGSALWLQSNFAPLQTIPLMSIGSPFPLATTGNAAYVGVDIGAGTNDGANTSPAVNWTATAGSGSLAVLRLSPTINQTGSASGSYTALKIAVTETALLGTANKLIDCFAGPAGTTEMFAIDNTGKATQYGSVATVSQGIPAEYAKVDLVTQSAAITATTLYAVPASQGGMYRISWCASVTTVDAAASVLGGTTGFQILYTDLTVVKTSPRTVTSGVDTDATNTTATAISGTIVVFADASTNIQYQMGYTSTTPGQMVYNLHIKLERM